MDASPTRETIPSAERRAALIASLKEFVARDRERKAAKNPRGWNATDALVKERAMDSVEIGWPSSPVVEKRRRHLRRALRRGRTSQIERKTESLVSALKKLSA